jgi:hypothetical protein
MPVIGPQPRCWSTSVADQVSAGDRDSSNAGFRATVLDGALRAKELVVAEDYRGYDPYDALASPVFRWPLLRARLVRRVAQQVLKRSPVNVRPLLGISKGRNPVTLALGVQAWAQLASVDAEHRDWYAAEATRLVRELEGLATPGWSGACWGYDFDWETRDSTIQAFLPTIVATGFVTNALVAAHERLEVDGALELCESACAFVQRDLFRTPGPDGSFCWSYSPDDRGRVLNATAKGARLLAQVGALAGRPELFVEARQTLDYVAHWQRDDGSWPYAVDDPRTWADNFHTAYVLDAMTEYRARTGDAGFDDAVDRGWRYYRSRFFDDGWRPRYYDTSALPVDCTAVAQSIITLCRFGDVSTALRIGAWSVEELQRDDGGFVYRVNRRHTNRIQYIRWSTAWMLAGLATALAAAEHDPDDDARRAAAIPDTARVP